MTDRIQLVIELVHGIDALEAERAALVADIDAKIRQAREDLATLTQGAMPRVTPTSNRKRGTGQRLCELIKSTPDAPIGIRAVQLYGEDTSERRGMVRSLIRSLRKKGILRDGENGLEVVEDAPSDPTEPSPEPPLAPT